MVKGILEADDARAAADHGADAIIVSNHGGRIGDGLPATIEVLPDIAAAVGGRCEIFLDGGVRRGTDVLKALALGAQAVLVGRPVWWGLTIAGEDGVTEILELLRLEFLDAMRMSGCPSIADLHSGFVKQPSSTALAGRAS